jgi:hypothetical protein
VFALLGCDLQPIAWELVRVVVFERDGAYNWYLSTLSEANLFAVLQRSTIYMACRMAGLVGRNVTLLQFWKAAVSIFLRAIDSPRYWNLSDLW